MATTYDVARPYATRSRLGTLPHSARLTPVGFAQARWVPSTTGVSQAVRRPVTDVSLPTREREPAADRVSGERHAVRRRALGFVQHARAVLVAMLAEGLGQPLRHRHRADLVVLRQGHVPLVLRPLDRQPAPTKVDRAPLERPDLTRAQPRLAAEQDRQQRQMVDLRRAVDHGLELVEVMEVHGRLGDLEPARRARPRLVLAILTSIGADLQNSIGPETHRSRRTQEVLRAIH